MRFYWKYIGVNLKGIHSFSISILFRVSKIHKKYAGEVNENYVSLTHLSCLRLLNEKKKKKIASAPPSFKNDINYRRKHLVFPILSQNKQIENN